MTPTPSSVASSVADVTQGTRFLRWLRDPLHWVALTLGIVPFLYLLRFIREHAANIPRYDSATRVFEISVAAEVGTLRPSQLFEVVNNHISAPAYALAALLTRWTDWNIHIEVGINTVMAVCLFIALMVLVWRTEPDALAMAIFPASLLYFSVQQNAVWLVGYTGFVLFLIHILSLACVVLVLYGSHRWWAMGLAFVLATISTFTNAPGILAWVLIGLTLVLKGVRDWRRYALVVAFTSLNLLLYLWLASRTPETDAATTSLFALQDLRAKVDFGFAYLGNMVSRGDVLPAVHTGMWAVGLFTLNVALVILLDKDRHFAQLWIPIASYTLLAAVLTALARTNTRTPPITSWYITQTNFFWITLVVSTAVIVARARTRTDFRYVRYAAVAVNLLVWAAWGTTFVPSNTESLERVIDQGRFLNERCQQRFLYIQDSEAMSADGCLVWYPQQMNVLAALELSMFAQAPHANILGNTYLDGQPIVVEAYDGWINYHIQQWLLDGVPDEHIYHIAPAQPEVLYPEVDVRLNNLTSPTEVRSAFVPGSNSIWHVRVADADIAPSAEWEQLADDEYIPTRFVHETAFGIPLEVTRYEKYELETEQQVRFGNTIEMVGFTGVGGRVQPCTTVTVRSFWQADEPLPVSYSATLTLDRITGDSAWAFETIARKDSQLTLTPSQQWEADTLYLDDRTLDVPCELEPGDYALQIGVYNYADGARLLPTIDDTLQTQDLARLERFTLAD